MLNCKYVLKKISLYIDNYLSSKEMEDFKNHIKKCENCKKELENTKKMINSLKNLKKFDVPEDFHKNLINKIKKINKEKESNFYKWNIIAASIIIFLFINNFLVLFISEKMFCKDLNIKSKSINIEESNLSSSINCNLLDKQEDLQNECYINTKLEIETNNMEKTISNLKNIINIEEIDKYNNYKYNKSLYINKEIYKEDYNNIIKNIDNLGTLIFKEEVYKNKESKEEIKHNIEFYKKEKEKLLSLLNTNISIEDKETVNINIDKITKLIEYKNKQLLNKDINNIVNLNLKIDKFSIKEKFYLDLKKEFYESFSNKRNFITKIFLPKNIAIIISIIIILNIIFYFFKRRIKYDK